MDEHDDLLQRLRALGTQPVDSAVRSAHLTALARVPARRSLRPKLRIAAAFLAGLLVGGSGLAAAGALPDPAQHAAHEALDGVGISVPDPERYHGPECGSEVKKNHGQYVRDDKDLAKSDCGKKVKAGGDDGDSDEVGDSDATSDRPECQGPPPWAGPNKKSMTKEEKAAAQAERAALCGEESDEAEVEDEAETDDPEARATPTTPTTEPTTTTTSEPTTTTSTTTSTTSTTQPEPEPNSGS